MISFYESLTPFILIAFAIGMDAFSVSMSVGLMRQRLRMLAYFIGLVGLFHIIMPLFGMGLGNFLSHQLGAIAQIIGGWMLIMIGAQMAIAIFFEKNMERYVGYASLFILAFTVSLDSFSIGITIGMLGINLFVVVILFGIISMLCCWAGIMLAQQGERFLGRYSEAIGGVVLIGIGIQMVW
ncbi:manganese efflux pump MntP family protein [Alkalibacillus haloalkaliphilus]|uniref:manganese efflux pump MntP n=1 Tax=Alkalibacillus haloalkaliphilus TaxID=94136 RepID=UPI0003171CDF|nr:manganese efflux pump [Alkalibacillus haloalkaliphilus]